MKIDELPAEMLMAIFNFLPTYGEVSLVNKLFNSIACKVNSNICLCIDQPFIERFLCNNVTSSELLQSMKLSIRKISKVVICEFDNPENSFVGDQGQTILSVIKTFSTWIKFLKLENICVDESTLLEILTLTPNIQQLGLYGVFRNSRDPSPWRHHCYEDLNLKMLKSVKINSDPEFVHIFNRLPADTLKQLHINNHREMKLDVLLTRQKNIEDLKLTYYIGDEGVNIIKDIFGKLELDYLELNPNLINSVTIAAILSQQNKLKSLILYRDSLLNEKVNVDERVMNIVASRLELEVLRIDVTRISVSSFMKIRYLKKLTDLTLRCDEDDGGSKLQALAELNNPSIKKLSLSWGTKMSVDLIGTLAKSVPHLRHFKVLLSRSRITNVEQDVIISHFNFVEVLEMPSFSNFLRFTNDYFNPKLRELTISDYIENKDINQSLPKLIVAYPNLKKLKLQGGISILDIRTILNEFTKLESLVVQSTCPLIVEDLDYINDHKNNLKFVTLDNLMEGTLTEDLVKKLRQNFDVVNVDFDDLDYLIVAVDRYTMDCERENIF